jgi:hypothetical protein
MKRLATLCSAILFITLSVLANDVQVSGITLTGDNPNGQPAFTNVQFNLSWKNSWRDTDAPSPTANWDAVWLFVKFKDESGFYRHATLSTNSAHHNGQGFTVAPAPDGKGVLIHRSTAGSGNVNLSNVQLRWTYCVDMTVPIAAVQVQVFAIEMVYVPQGAFFVGDSSFTNINNQFARGGTIEPYLITSENELTLGGTNTNNLANRNNTGASFSDDFTNTQTRTLPAAFPKGFRAFYCMKYELSFGQMAEFYNNLSAQQLTAIGGATANLTGNRAATFSGTHPNLTTNRADRAIAYNFSSDGVPRALRYLAWAGLRPMTELEFEKACRGVERGVPDEFAWGNASAVAATSISGNEDGTETITNAQANVNYNGVTFTNGDAGTGTLRVGIFAKSGTGRTQAGASYYGIMDLSGNVEETVVTVGNTQGRAFTGVHGSGNLNPSGGLLGNEVSDWQSGFLTTRGGNWNDNFLRIRVSDRNRPVTNNNQNLRGVRTAP